MTKIQHVPSNSKQTSKTDQVRAMREEKAMKAEQAAKKSTNVANASNTESSEAPKAPKAKKEKKDRPSAALRVAVPLNRLQVRIAKLAAKVGKWDAPRVAGPDGGERVSDVVVCAGRLEQAVAILDGVGTMLRQLPADFTGKAPKAAKEKAAAKVELGPGAIVGLRDSARKDYEDILEPGEFDELTVKRSNGKKVIVRTLAGNVLVLRRGDLILKTAQG
jgi:hypothetical protein